VIRGGSLHRLASEHLAAVEGYRINASILIYYARRGEYFLGAIMQVNGAEIAQDF
jgi:hypothetical protein